MKIKKRTVKLNAVDDIFSFRFSHLPSAYVEAQTVHVHSFIPKFLTKSQLSTNSVFAFSFSPVLHNSPFPSLQSQIYLTVPVPLFFVEHIHH